jgi:uncharacterized surface protein with fasciclin (FAS1) repeats
MNIRLLSASATIALGMGAAAMVAADREVGGAPLNASKNIVQNAVHSRHHTTLVAAVTAKS